MHLLKQILKHLTVKNNNFAILPYVILNNQIFENKEFKY